MRGVVRIDYHIIYRGGVEIGYVILVAIDGTTLLVPYLLVKPLQLFWRSGTCRGNLQALIFKWIAGLILGLRPANERCRYKVTQSLIGWTQT